MLTPGRIFRRLRSLVTMRHRDRELDEELAFHIEMETARHVRDGADEASARLMAHRSFGGVPRHRDDTRDSRGVTAVEDFLSDLRIGARSLLRERVFTTTAVLTLAVGIGGTTAIFGAVYGILFAPLPYTDPDRIVTVWQTDRTTGAREEVAAGTFLDWRARSRAFAHLAVAEPFSLDFIGPEGPERFSNSKVTEGFFEALGARPLLGRTFVRDEFGEGRNNVAVISEKLWRTRFGADPSLVGRVLVLDSIPMTIVGVMPAAVDVPHGEQFWTPKVFRPDELKERAANYLAVVGRLRPGVTVAAARSEMSTIAAQLAGEYPQTNAKVGAEVVSLEDTLLAQTRGGLFLLLGAVFFVLVISCANVASLQLAQAIRRRRELAIRAALGAGRSRLVRQLLTESLLLALVGGAAGVLIAYWGIHAVRTLAPPYIPRLDELGLNGPALFCALVTSIATALFFGMVPVADVGRVTLNQVIAAGGRSVTAARGSRRTYRAFVVAEVALALVLLVAAGLLMKSFALLLRVDRGFETAGVSVITVQTWGYYPTRERRIHFVRDAVATLSALPGVRAVAMSSSLPISPRIGQDQTRFEVEGRPVQAGGSAQTAQVAAVTAAYFNALRIPLRAGRLLTDADNEAAPRVVVVNEAFAKRHWPGENPIGKRVTFGFQAAPSLREVVGVVGNVRHEGLASDAPPAMFVPHAQAPTGAVNLVIASDIEAATILRAARAKLVEMNSAMPLSETTTLDARLADSLRERRFHLLIFGAFAVTALLLAGIGVYGMMSHLTTERTHEIGVRMAVGAHAKDVAAMVVRQGAAVAAIGIALGVVGAVLLTRLMAHMLFHVTALDPLTFGIAIATLFAAAITACWVPARRAAAVDPITALRND